MTSHLANPGAKNFDDMFEKNEQEIVFKKNEFQASQNQYGTKIIELHKTIPVKVSVISGSVTLSVIVETNGNEFYWEPQSLE